MNNFEMSDEQRKELKPIWAAIEVFGRHFDAMSRQIAEDEAALIFTNNYTFNEEATHKAVIIADVAVQELGKARLAFSKVELEKMKKTMDELYEMETKALNP